MPLRILGNRHKQRAAPGEAVFHPGRPLEQRPELRGGHVGLIQLLLNHDPSAGLPRGVLLAKQLLNRDGLQHRSVARRDSHELDEKLDSVRVVVPVRPGFERLGAVVVGEEPVKLFALVLLPLVEQRTHAARDLHPQQAVNRVGPAVDQAAVIRHLHPRLALSLEPLADGPRLRRGQRAVSSRGQPAVPVRGRSLGFLSLGRRDLRRRRAVSVIVRRLVDVVLLLVAAQLAEEHEHLGALVHVVGPGLGLGFPARGGRRG